MNLNPKTSVPLMLSRPDCCREKSSPFSTGKTRLKAMIGWPLKVLQLRNRPCSYETSVLFLSEMGKLSLRRNVLKWHRALHRKDVGRVRWYLPRFTSDCFVEESTHFLPFFSRGLSTLHPVHYGRVLYFGMSSLRTLV